jgi:tetratricopeptide (TPR) repeat protein
VVRKLVTVFRLIRGSDAHSSLNAVAAAREQLRQLYEQCSDDAVLQRELLTGFLQMGDELSAAGNYSSGIAVYSDAMQRAQALVAAGKLSGSEAIVRDLHRGLASAYVAIGNESEAQVHVRAALATTPHVGHALAPDQAFEHRLLPQNALVNDDPTRGIGYVLTLSDGHGTVLASKRFDSAEEARYVASQMPGLISPQRGQARAATELAIAAERLGFAGVAESLHRKALNMYRSELPDTRADVAESLDNLGRLLQKTGRFAEAEPLLREALSVRRETLGRRAPPTTRAAGNLADLLDQMGRRGDAAAMRKEFGLPEPTERPAIGRSTQPAP